MPATWPPSTRGARRGRRDPANRPTAEEIIAVMRVAGDDAEGARLRGLIVVLWRAGLTARGRCPLPDISPQPDGAFLFSHG